MTLIQQGDNLPPAAYDTLNMGNIVSLFKTLQNRTDPAVQVDAWKAKLAVEEEKEIQEKMLALIHEPRSHTVQVL